MTTPAHARQIGDLAKRLDRLLDATRKLSTENILLKQQLEQLNSERNFAPSSWRG